MNNFKDDKHNMWRETWDLMPACVMNVFNTPMSVCCG